MPRFEITVIETRQYECRYEVEAADLDEAEVMAARGETVSELEGRCRGVTERYID